MPAQPGSQGLSMISPDGQRLQPLAADDAQQIAPLLIGHGRSGSAARREG